MLHADIKERLDRIYPEREVTVTTSDPSYLTPELKSLLRKKNRIMTSGRTDASSPCTARIGKAIEKITKNIEEESTHALHRKNYGTTLDQSKERRKTAETQKT